ncbi:MAG TPA: TIGR04283 family arsenosugar biosynthesis glycosyltransferase [Pyrinomonadaceae bacterium]|jgi:rSAM/selenodomain-associated transferase 2
MKPEISIIIPTLNEEESIRDTLRSLQNFENAEIVVVDGGSTDATLLIAENYPVSILHAPRGRGSQLSFGADEANGDVLWFLHADTIPSPDAVEEIKRALTDPRVAGGNFTIRFDGERRAAKFLSWLYPRLNLLGLIYGDSAIFVRRGVYRKIGGFEPFPIFEDLDFIERLKAEGEIVTLSSVVTTSSRRFENKSFILTFARWTILQVLYWVGVSPYALLKIYFPAAKKN